MMISNDLISRARNVALPAIMVSILAYFAYHTVEGNHGLLARSRLEHQMPDLQKRADALHSQRQRLERRVALLRPDNLDPDLLAEEAHRVLGYARPDEMIILTPKHAAEPQQ